jgi:hypothetical protein
MTLPSSIQSSATSTTTHTSPGAAQSNTTTNPYHLLLANLPDARPKRKAHLLEKSFSAPVGPNTLTVSIISAFQKTVKKPHSP